MVEAIYMLIAFAMALLYIAFNKKDSTLIFFSGILFILSGLDIFLNGFGGFEKSIAIAIIILFIGIYLIVRVGIEMIADKVSN